MVVAEETEKILMRTSQEEDKENARGTWPIYSADHSMSVHYEADVLIGDNGPIDLTEGLQDLPNIVGI